MLADDGWEFLRRSDAELLVDVESAEHDLDVGDLHAEPVLTLLFSPCLLWFISFPRCDSSRRETLLRRLLPIRHEVRLVLPAQKLDELASGECSDGSAGERRGPLPHNVEI